MIAIPYCLALIAAAYVAFILVTWAFAQCLPRTDTMFDLVPAVMTLAVFVTGTLIIIGGYIIHMIWFHAY